MTLSATCPACGTVVDVIPVVQRAELLRSEHRLLVNFEAFETEHSCVDPRQDRPVAACPEPGCTVTARHLHYADGGYMPLPTLLPPLP